MWAKVIRNRAVILSVPDKQEERGKTMAYIDRKSNLETVVTQEKTKVGLVLQGGAALGAYEVGAIEYLYESGMECAIVAGASSGAVNAVTLAGAKEYPPKVLRMANFPLVDDPPRAATGPFANKA